MGSEWMEGFNLSNTYFKFSLYYPELIDNIEIILLYFKVALIHAS